MANQTKASSTVGMEIQGHQLHVVCASLKNRQPRIDQLFSISLEEGDSTSAHVKPLYMEGQESLLRSKMRDGLVVTSLSEKDVLIRHLFLEVKTDKEIDSVFEFQAEPLIPYPIDEAVIDKMIVEKGSENSLVAMAGCKTDKLAQHLEVWHSMDVEPEVVACVPVALAAFAEVLYPSLEPFILFHVDEAATTGILIYQKKLIASQTISRGIQSLVDSLKEDLSSTEEEASRKIFTLDFQNISAVGFPALAKSWTDFPSTLLRLLYALKKQPHGDSVQQIVFTGIGANLLGSVQVFSGALQYPLMTSELMQDLSQPIETVLRRAICVGNAFMGLPGTVNQVDFRQKDFAYPNPWKRIKKPLTAYLFLSLALSASIYLCGTAYLADKQDLLKKKYIDLLTLTRKNYSEVEAEVAKKSASPPLAHAVQDPIHLTKEEIEYRLQLLQKEIQTTPDMFPLHPNTPRVSDLLAWLSSLPLVNAEQGESRVPKISLESLSYKMVKKPENNRKMEKYQVKVEIEFSSPLPRYAREFHDFLLSPNDLVDPAGEVKWSTDRGKYRATFFLKDKTSYPGGR